MIDADRLAREWPLSEISPGVWVLSRPLDGPWIWRVMDAWDVLMGRADAVKFRGQ